MDEYIAYRSRTKLTLSLFGSIAFVLLGLVMTGEIGSSFWPSRNYGSLYQIKAETYGWGCVVLFGLCAVLTVRLMFGAREILRINQKGIFWRAWSNATIPWSEITDVTISEVANQRFINLHLLHPLLFPGRGLNGALQGINRGMTGGDISLTLGGTGGTVEQAMAAITRFRQGPSVQASGFGRRRRRQV